MGGTSTKNERAAESLSIIEAEIASLDKMLRVRGLDLRQLLPVLFVKARQRLVHLEQVAQVLRVYRKLREAETHYVHDVCVWKA